jgi:hypothetical protein
MQYINYISMKKNSNKFGSRGAVLLATVMVVSIVAGIDFVVPTLAQDTTASRTAPQAFSNTFDMANITAANTTDAAAAINEIPMDKNLKGIIIDEINNSTTMVEGREAVIDKRSDTIQALASEAVARAICWETWVVIIDGDVWIVDIWYEC